MRLDLKNMMDADLDHMVADQGDEAIIGSTTVSVIASNSTEDAHSDEVGDMPVANLVLTVKSNAMTKPSLETLVSYNSKSYRLSSITTDADLNAWQFVCKAINE